MVDPASTASTTLDPQRIVAAIDARLPLAVRILEELRARSVDEAGVTRPSYGPGEQIGHDLMRAAANEGGLEVTTDAAGNLYATLPGLDRDASRWLSGSHFDSVPHGGNYDGAAGAVAALVSILALKDLGISPRQDMTAMAIRAEECSSWFTGEHGGHLGSRAALGLLQPSELDTAIHLGSGRTLGQSIEDAGFDADAVRRGPPPLSAKTVRGFVELHIEQGPVLVRQGVSVGIVTSIRGTVRARDARCVGAYSHSGAVPQELRQDAVLATAELINRIEKQCDEVRSAGGDVVFSVGRFHTDAAVDSLSKVPGEVRFTIDLRCQDASVLLPLNPLLDRYAQEIGTRRNVRFELGRRAVAEPTAMNPAFRSVLRNQAALLGIEAPEIPCGAGHDAAEFVRANIPSCMIFVRNTGESHNPDEDMELADFRDGVLLLTSFLAEMTLPPSVAGTQADD
jgi:N-carbamoyl-L-amino-acid hydrolase